MGLLEFRVFVATCLLDATSLEKSKSVKFMLRCDRLDHYCVEKSIVPTCAQCQQCKN